MNEKEKGNECFRVGDYEEAVVYYSRSLDAVDTTDGTTPLHNACEMGLGKVALQLIASGHVDCAVQNTVDSTDPLHWATHNGLGKVAAALRAKASERDAQYIE